MGGRGGGEVGIYSFSLFFAVFSMENPPRRGGVQWKRPVLGGGGGGFAPQHWPL